MASGRAQQPVPPPSTPPTSGVADFKLSVEPDSVTVRRGGTARLKVTVTSVAGFKGRVELISSLLYGTTMNFEPAAVELGAGGTSTLNVAPDRSAIKGAYVITITGIDGGISHMLTVRVNVR